MQGVVESLFRLSVPHGKLNECICSLEDGLRALKETPYHAVLGCDFLHHLDDAADFIASFFRAASRDTPIGAMYFAMHEAFVADTTHWSFSGLAYEKGGDIHDLTWNTDWIRAWDHESGEFPLTGMEPARAAFRRLYNDPKQPLGIQMAGEITQYLVVARFNQLIGAAHRAAKETCPGLCGFPILSSAEEWDTLCPSQ